MKKTKTLLLLLLLNSMNSVKAQNCTGYSVNLTAEKQKICKGESTNLQALPTNSSVLPDFINEQNLFNISDLKLDPMVIQLINGGAVMGVKYPLAPISNKIDYTTGGPKLTKATISSGTLEISITTDLKQELTVVLELPYFKKQGIVLKDSILIKPTSTSGKETFTKTIDLSNSEVDFSSGVLGDFNKIEYKITPKLKITSTVFTNNEKGDLKLTIKNMVIQENTSYEWFKNDVNLNNGVPTLNVTESGDYRVEVSSVSCGLIKKNIAISVIEYPLKSTKLAGSSSFCKGDSVAITADGDGTFLWSNQLKTKTIYAKTTDNLTVTVTHDICSVISDPIKITVNENPIAKITTPNNKTSYNEGESILLTALGGKTYSWNTSQQQDTLRVKKAGHYTVTVTNEFGCKSSTSIHISSTLGVQYDNTLFSIYPNPTSESITIDHGINSPIYASFIDVNGKVLWKQECPNHTNIELKTKLKNGNYFIYLTNDSNELMSVKQISIK
jgi:hypothetical protein